jgi:hypothetical protein
MGEKIPYMRLKIHEIIHFKIEPVHLVGAKVALSLFTVLLITDLFFIGINIHQKLLNIQMLYGAWRSSVMEGFSQDNKTPPLNKRNGVLIFNT